MNDKPIEITPEQKWEKATIANNFIFYKVMRHNPDVCKELLEILLEFKIDHIEMKQEEEIEIDYGKIGKGLGKYTFENTCIENSEIKLNDRAYKYFFIAKNYDKILNEEQRAFLRLVTSNESTSLFADKLSQLVDNAKQNTQWRKQFMDFQHYMSQSFREGKEEKSIEVAINLLKEGDSPEKVSRCIGLPLEKVLELKQQILVEV